MIIMIVQILLRADSSMINVTIADEGTAAHVACEKGHAEVSPMPSRRYLEGSRISRGKRPMAYPSVTCVSRR